MFALRYTHIYKVRAATREGWGGVLHASTLPAVKKGRRARAGRRSSAVGGGGGVRRLFVSSAQRSKDVRLQTCPKRLSGAGRDKICRKHLKRRAGAETPPMSMEVLGGGGGVGSSENHLKSNRS